MNCSTFDFATGVTPTACACAVGQINMQGIPVMLTEALLIAAVNEPARVATAGQREGEKTDEEVLAPQNEPVKIDTNLAAIPAEVRAAEAGETVADEGDKSGMPSSPQKVTL